MLKRFLALALVVVIGGASLFASTPAYACGSITSDQCQQSVTPPRF